MKELDYTLVNICNQRKKHKTIADRYNEVINAKHKRIREIIESVTISVILIVLTLMAICKMYNSDYVYYNGNEYITEALCEVTEINGNTITVEHRGELYDFYGNGFAIGETIQCKFSEDMQIIKAE